MNYAKLTLLSLAFVATAAVAAEKKIDRADIQEIRAYEQALQQNQQTFAQRIAAAISPLNAQFDSARIQRSATFGSLMQQRTAELAPFRADISAKESHKATLKSAQSQARQLYKAQVQAEKERFLKARNEANEFHERVQANSRDSFVGAVSEVVQSVGKSWSVQAHEQKLAELETNCNQQTSTYSTQIDQLNGEISNVTAQIRAIEAKYTPRFKQLDQESKNEQEEIGRAEAPIRLEEQKVAIRIEQQYAHARATQEHLGKYGGDIEGGIARQDRLRVKQTLSKMDLADTAVREEFEKKAPKIQSLKDQAQEYAQRNGFWYTVAHTCVGAVAFCGAAYFGVSNPDSLMPYVGAAAVGAVGIGAIRAQQVQPLKDSQEIARDLEEATK